MTSALQQVVQQPRHVAVLPPGGRICEVRRPRRISGLSDQLAAGAEGAEVSDRVGVTGLVREVVAGAVVELSDLDACGGAGAGGHGRTLGAPTDNAGSPTT